MSAVEKLMTQLEDWTGIVLERGGRFGSFQRFLEERARELKVPSVDEYVAMLTGPLHPEVARLVNAVTVNYTWFYRDEEQMDALARLIREGWPPGWTLKIWIPGCSTGEDAYTLAMLARRAERQAFILATDINSEALDHARTARYGKWSLRDVSDALRGFFTPSGKSTFEVCAPIRQSVSFARHNLVDPPPPSPNGSGWDLILCRNVLIYFRPDAASEAHQRLGSSLAPGGWLVLGSSEVVYFEPPGLRIARLGERVALYHPYRSAGEAPWLARPFEVGVDAVAAALRSAAQPALEGAVFEPRLEALRGGGDAPVDPAREAPVEVEPLGYPFPKDLGVTWDVPALPPVPAPELSAAALVSEGNLYMQSNEIDRALSKYAKAREVDSLCVEAHLFMGIALHLAADPLAAVNALRAALFLDPHLWPAAFYLALSYENLGRHQDAHREYQRLLESSDRPIHFESRGNILGDLEAWKRDMLALAKRRALKARPKGENRS